MQCGENARKHNSEEPKRPPLQVCTRRPEGSSFTYGLISGVLAILALVFFGMFYRVEVLANPVLLELGLAMFFGLGIFLRRRRRRLQSQAFKSELQIREGLLLDD